ncbi:hypothetical protein GCM10028828_07970 [Corynebacterium tapiri]
MRAARGVSQGHLAELAGLSRNVISNLERNETSAGSSSDPRLSTIYRLAKALSVPPFVLLPGAHRHVDAVCVSHESEISAQWPTCPEDTARYSDYFLALGERGDTPEFALD